MAAPVRANFIRCGADAVEAPFLVGCILYFDVCCLNSAVSEIDVGQWRLTQRKSQNRSQIESQNCQNTWFSFSAVGHTECSYEIV